MPPERANLGEVAGNVQPQPPTPQVDDELKRLIPKLYKLHDVAKNMSMSARTLHRYAKAGKIPYYQFGGQIFFAPEHIAEFFQKGFHGQGDASAVGAAASEQAETSTEGTGRRSGRRRTK